SRCERDGVARDRTRAPGGSRQGGAGAGCGARLPGLRRRLLRRHVAPVLLLLLLLPEYDGPRRPRLRDARAAAAVPPGGPLWAWARHRRRKRPWILSTTGCRRHRQHVAS